MQITVISDWENQGGANIAAVRITRAISALGNKVGRVYQKADACDTWETTLIPSLLDPSGLSRSEKLKLRLFPSSYNQTRHQEFAEHSLRRILERIRPEVISLHNLHIASWSPQFLRICSEVAPTVCTLHDTWTFTGRCYNPGSCDKYLTRCDSTCPTASEYPAVKPARIGSEYEKRRSIFAECKNLAAVVPSKWLGGLATNGLWKQRKVFQIPYPIDLDCYKPLSRPNAKEVLGLSPNVPVLLCCAADLNNQKKGIGLFLDSLTGCGPIQLLLMGNPIAVAPIEGIQIHQLGYVFDDRLKAVVYNAADIYVHPSLADNAPLTVIESLSCGTPVVSFSIDGLPELVIPRKTGWLADEVSPAALNQTLRCAIDDIAAGKTMSGECRAFAVDRFNAVDVGKKYQSVFEHLISGTDVSALEFKVDPQPTSV